VSKVELTSTLKCSWVKCSEVEWRS